MNVLQRYVDRQSCLPFSIPDHSIEDPSIHIVIPCYNEPDVLTTLGSLAGCDPPKSSISVLIVINDADDSPEEVVMQNHLTLNTISEWKLLHPKLFFFLDAIYARALPSKWAGVGYARKIGMDNAVKQLVNNNIADGIIVSLDADSTVSANYLQEIENNFQNNHNYNFFTINFEHPIHTQKHNPDVCEGIIRYELHMRYFKNAMAWSGYPHAIYTVGSSFAVKASAYARQGGMNKRKAGEDFYFLHKLVLLGDYGNICTATVFPAARESDRVPFGTGAAIKKWIQGDLGLMLTYSLEAFNSLKPFFSMVHQFWQKEKSAIDIENLHPSLQLFCKNMQIFNEIAELKKNCSNFKVFEKRFFHLVNALWILKYLNFAHQSGFERDDLLSESVKLFYMFDIQIVSSLSIEDILMIYRNMDKGIQNCG